MSILQLRMPAVTRRNEYSPPRLVPCVEISFHAPVYYGANSRVVRILDDIVNKGMLLTN
jgi:hypothetical protein